MHSNKLAAKVASTAIVILIPIATLSVGASAAPKYAAHTERGTSINQVAPNAWSTRLSGLPAGGAALYDGVVPFDGTAFYHGGAGPAAVKQSAPHASSSRVSGLPFGGAALYV